MKIDDLTALTELLASQTEWLLIYDFGQSFPIKSTEIEIEFSGPKTLISFLSESGLETWRIESCEIDSGKIALGLIRNFDTEQISVCLVPRTGPRELSSVIEIARCERANRLAKLLAAEYPGARLVRVELNRENGRTAQILFDLNGQRTAALSDVTGSLTAECLLSAAILWLRKIGHHKKFPVHQVWILAQKPAAAKLRMLHACFTATNKSRVRIFEIRKAGQKKSLVEQKTLGFSGLWKFAPKELSFAPETGLSEFSKQIEKLAPGTIDAVFARHGETLRYHGLPFVRVRRIKNREKAWYYGGGNWKILDHESYEEFYEAFQNLRIYRRHDSRNIQHYCYQAAPEAWLESRLRRNIKLLDHNLILSPIYSQFRTSREKIDLLALRRDGRLVIIELKVSPDREMIFQAVDYWRQIELQRRKGILDKVNLFGARKIADRSALIYLAAPTLSYHRDFDYLSKTVSGRIGIYRFDLAESWRENVRVLGRRRILSER